MGFDVNVSQSNQLFKPCVLFPGKEEILRKSRKIRVGKDHIGDPAQTQQD